MAEADGKRVARIGEMPGPRGARPHAPVGGVLVYNGVKQRRDENAVAPPGRAPPPDPSLTGLILNVVQETAAGDCPIALKSVSRVGCSDRAGWRCRGRRVITLAAPADGVRGFAGDRTPMQGKAH